MELEILVIALGACVGSFLNVCICRIPAKQSTITGVSRCVGCGQRIRWLHKIPVISYVLLRGRCAACGMRIFPQYLLIEGLAAGFFLLLFRKVSFSAEFLVWGVLGSLLLVAAGIDLKTLRIPNRLIVFGITTWVALSILFDLNLLNGLLAGLLGGGLLFLVAWIGKAVLRKESMGMGDVKLAFVIGLFLGTEGVLLALLLAFLAGGLVATAGLMLGVLNRDSRVPFGPLLALGALIYMIGGSSLLRLPFWLPV